VVNVTDQSSLCPLVQNCQVVISYVPAFLHVHVAKACLKMNKHLVTASYVSPEMKELHEQAKKQGLTFLN
jgi:saccharopine dehydrogenase-like NADP-dependent oxidoreductase